MPAAAVEAWLMAPWAASVPVPLSAPLVRLRVPATVSVVPAAMVFVPVNVALFRVTKPPVSMIAPPPPLNVTVPPGAANVPPLTVTAPVTVRVPIVAVNEPPLSVSGPLTVMFEVPPTNVAPDLTNPEAPTVIAMPAACVTVPVYPAVTLIPATLIATLIVAFLEPVASKVATSAAPGTSPPSQLPASFQLFVRPRPVHVLVAALAGFDERRSAPTTPSDSASAKAIRRRSRFTRGRRTVSVGMRTRSIDSIGTDMSGQRAAPAQALRSPIGGEIPFSLARSAVGE